MNARSAVIQPNGAIQVQPHAIRSNLVMKSCRQSESEPLSQCAKRHVNGSYNTAHKVRSATQQRRPAHGEPRRALLLVSVRA
jgi:hypothetical protein